MEQTAPVSSVAPRSAVVRLSVVVVSALVIIACVVALVLLITAPPKADASKLSDDRAAVTSVANTFVLGQFTFDKSMLKGTTMPSFRAKVEAVITPKFDVTFQTLAGKIEGVVQASGLKSTAKVWSTGVAAIDGNTATVLVVGSYSNFLPKTKGGTDYQSAGEVPFRDVVSLVKSNGTWLVDSQAPAEGLPPSAVPTASATPAPTSGASQ